MLRTYLCLLALTLVACGGGGGGGSKLNISLSPDPLEASYTLATLPSYITAHATVAGTVSTGTVYVVIADSGKSFAAGPAYISQESETTFAADLPLASNLQPGDHTGTLTVRVCSDSACSSVLGSSQLPYHISIATPSISSATPIVAAAIRGGELNVTAVIHDVAPHNLYASIGSASDDTFQTGSVVPLTYDIADTFEASVPVPASVSATAHQGSLTLRICGDAHCQQVFDEAPLSYTVQVFAVLAGQPGIGGNADGPGSAATFLAPRGIALDSVGNLYVADASQSGDSGLIRKIDPAGNVSTTLVSSGGAYGGVAPKALAVDAAGNLLFSELASDYGNHNGIYRRAPDGTTTLFSEGVGDLATDVDDHVYSFYEPCDGCNATVTKMNSDGTYDPTWNAHGALGFANPNSVAGAADGVVYVAVGTGLNKLDQQGESLDSTYLSGFAIEQLAIAPDGAPVFTGYPWGGCREECPAAYRISPDKTLAPFIPTILLPNGLGPVHAYDLAFGSNGQFFISDTDGKVILQTTLAH